MTCLSRFCHVGCSDMPVSVLMLQKRSHINQGARDV
jgi:hypothetical protein